MTLSPQPQVSEADRETGLRRVVGEAGFAGAAGAVTSGVILTAFALELGAGNGVIGLLAAATFLTQPLQAPTILLVERLRMRKRIAVLASIGGRAALVGMAALAFLPSQLGIPILIGLQFVYCALSAVGTCAWNAWMRDLAPDERVGSVFSRRTLNSTLATLFAGLAAAVALDIAKAGSPWRPWMFAGLYLIGGAAGLVSAAIVSKIPEPQMPRPVESESLRSLLSAPFRDINFRRLIAFLASWQFAANLATPFFTVFMVKQLGYSMTFVMVVTVLSQGSNALAVSSWGLLSDRFSNKTMLGAAAPLYIMCIAVMVGASQISDHRLGAVYLAGLHVVMGLAVAGVTLGSTNIALKLSPKGNATAYLAANAMVSSLAAGVAPILGGLCADYFAARRLDIVLRLTHPQGAIQLRALTLSSWDFYFLGAAVLGLYAVHRLALVREEGEVERRALVNHLLSESGRAVRSLSSVPGLRALTNLPSNFERERRIRARLARARARAGQ